MTTLILVRHGETDWNRTGRIQGVTDIPLNATGRRQAKDAATRLRDRIDESAVVVSSDLSRAHETARIIAAEVGLTPPRLYAQLRERSYGEAEGITDVEFDTRWGPWRTAAVPGAELPAQLRRRAVKAIETVRAELPDDARQAIVVSHGAFIRALVHELTGGALPLPGTRIGNGGGFTLVYDDAGVRVVDDAAALT